MLLGGCVVAFAVLRQSPPSNKRFTISSSTAGVAAIQCLNGTRFWSLGVDCVDTGELAKDLNPKNPAYSILNLKLDEKAWVDQTLTRLKGWGFNSLGAWSDADLFRKYAPERELPFFPVLHLCAWGQGPFHDLFAPAMEKAMDEGARTQIPKMRDDPNLVGYFTDNELGWWGDTLFLAYLKMKPEAPGHRAIVESLRKTYHGSPTAFHKDWISDAKSFESIKSLKLRPGTGGIRAVNDWMGTLGKRYYSLVRGAIRRYDTRHMILGERFCQYYNLATAKASSPYIDVASTNYGSEFHDGSMSQFYLDGLHQATGKPVLIGEFYMCAMENRSGNKNASDGFPIVQTQKQRAEAFSQYVRSAASRPYVVGAHWFQYYDEPTHGRGDGENYNMGLVDIHGVPYDEITKAAASLDIPAIRAHLRAPKPSTTVTVSEFEGKRDLQDWNPDKQLVPPAPGLPIADMYAAKDAQNLYLGLMSMDYLDESIYPNDKIPEVDRDLWTVRIPGLKKPIRVRFIGKHRPVFIEGPATLVQDEPGLKYRLIIAIPRRLLASGKISLTATFSTHGRGSSMSWRNVLALGSRRGK